MKMSMKIETMKSVKRRKRGNFWGKSSAPSNACARKRKRIENEERLES